MGFSPWFPVCREENAPGKDVASHSLLFPGWTFPSLACAASSSAKPGSSSVELGQSATAPHGGVHTPAAAGTGITCLVLHTLPACQPGTSVAKTHRGTSSSEAITFWKLGFLDNYSAAILGPVLYSKAGAGMLCQLSQSPRRPLSQKYPSVSTPLFFKRANLFPRYFCSFFHQCALPLRRRWPSGGLAPA